MDEVTGDCRRMQQQRDENENSTESASNRESMCRTLHMETGWRWEPSELAHFRARPKSFTKAVMLWRRELVSKASKGGIPLLSTQAGRPLTLIRTDLDDAIGVLREIVRILVTLEINEDTSPIVNTSHRKLSADLKAQASLANRPSALILTTLTRLNPFRGLGVQVSHKASSELVDAMWELVPPSMRPNLAVSLMRHAQTTCLVEQPDCERCELARFCAFYRQQSVELARDSDKPIFVDLFCGAGGISVGFSRAGYRPVLAIDASEAACATYRLNFCDIPEGDVICADIRESKLEDMQVRLGGRRLDVLIGAPPCQGFSLAGMISKQALAARKTLSGYSITEDDRNFFFEYLVGAAVSLRPKLLLMENVPGMDSPRPRGTPSFMRVAEGMLQDAGFLTTVWKIDAAGYGVPQRRIRTFLVGSLLDRLPHMPEPEFQHSASRAIDPDLLPALTLDCAIFDLPPLEADGGTVITKRGRVASKDDRRFRHYLRNRRFPITNESGLIFNHKVRYHNERDLELYALLQPGEDSVHIIERHGRGDLMRYRRDVFDDKYARLRPDQPSKTIVSHLAKDGNSYIHPDQARSITPREGARLQSFPDNFVFCGSPMDQWTQIGNSVPPALAVAIAKSFRDLLNRESLNERNI